MTTLTTPVQRTDGRVLTVVATIVLAVLAPLAVWTVAVPLVGVDLAAAVGPGETPEAVGAAAVASAAFTAALAGWVAVAVLERFSRRPLAVWRASAVVLLLLSLVPLIIPGETTVTSRLVLAATHLAVAVVLVPGVRRTSSRVERS